MGLHNKTGFKKLSPAVAQDGLQCIKLAHSKNPIIFFLSKYKCPKDKYFRNATCVRKVCLFQTMKCHMPAKTGHPFLLFFSPDHREPCEQCMATAMYLYQCITLSDTFKFTLISYQTSNKIYVTVHMIVHAIYVTV